ncbi:MAG: hypothetical protein ACFFC7_18640 [Candidatus Hermodarchaeota archaeon]
MNDSRKLHNSKVSLRVIILGIQLAMMASFLVFSLIPLLSYVIFFLPYFYPFTFILFIVLILLLASIAIFGMITLRSQLRLITTLFFSFGTLFNFFDPYMLSLGLIISWLFYELWFQLMIFRQLDEEYVTYLPESIEKTKLMRLFQDQLSSFGLFAWIVLLISWGILFFASNFYIELGEEKGFGTLGLTLSIIIILAFYLGKKVIKNNIDVQSPLKQG